MTGKYPTEKVIDGVLHWRKGPFSAWIPRTATELTAMLLKEQELSSSMTRLVLKLPCILGDIRHD